MRASTSPYFVLAQRAGLHADYIWAALHIQLLHVSSAVRTADQAGQGALHRTVLFGWTVPAGHDFLNLIVELFVHDGRMKPVGDCPLFPGVIDRDVFCVPVGAFLMWLFWFHTTFPM